MAKDDNMETHLLKTPSPLFEEIRAGRKDIRLKRAKQPYEAGDVLSLIEVTTSGRLPGNRICRRVASIAECDAQGSRTFAIELGDIEEHEPRRREKWR